MNSIELIKCLISPVSKFIRNLVKPLGFSSRVVNDAHSGLVVQYLIRRQTEDIILTISAPVSVHPVYIQLLLRFLRLDILQSEVGGRVADYAAPAQHQLHRVLL